MRKVGSEGHLGIMVSLMVLCLLIFGLLGSVVEESENQEYPAENTALDVQDYHEQTQDAEFSSDFYIPYLPSPTPFTLTQPDGKEFQARMEVDWTGGHEETMDGYTIIEDGEGWWTYAVKGDDGILAPTFNRVGEVGIEQRLTQPKHLANDPPPGLSEVNFDRGTRAPPWNGTFKALAIMLNFTNETFMAGHNQSYFAQMLNSTTSNSMRTYYREVSYGTFDVEVDVIGPFNSSETLQWYGEDGTGRDNANGQISNMAKEAVQLADPFVDFTEYDGDSDGDIDALFIINAGPGQEGGGGPYGSDAIWSHMGFTNYLTDDGVWAGVYSTEPDDGKIGVFAHEFGHALGLPDLYDRDGSSNGIGQWGIMAGGSWNGGGNSPAHFSAWSRMKLGWIEPIIVTSDVSLTQIEIPPVENNSVVYKVWAHNASQNTDEYFLIENRQKIGFDSALPGDGILIWHIDESVTTQNDNESHYLVDLEEADGDPPNDPTDPWKNTVTGFRNTTDPNSTSYNGSDTYVWVWNISTIAGDGNMSLGFNEIYSGPTGIYLSDPISNMTIDTQYDFIINDTDFPDEDIGSDSDGNNGSYILQHRHANTTDPWEVTPSQTPISWMGGGPSVINCTALVEGFYDYRVRIIDEEGHLMYTPEVINVAVPGNIPPVADAGPDNISDINVPVFLNGSGSYDNSGYIAWFNWSFANGTYYNVTEAIVPHIFTGPGIYTVTLNVSDYFGNWDNDTVNITVMDMGPPTTTLTIVGPKYRENMGDNYNVTEDTSFTLSPEDNYSGVNFTWYTIDGEYFEGLLFTLFGYPDGEYDITWGSMDNASNNETGNYMVVNVDNTPPDTVLDIDIPKYQQNPGDPWNVTDMTLFTLTPTEAGSGVNYTWYWIEGDKFEGTSFYITGYVDGEISILWKTEDNLGNFQLWGKLVNLDTSSPITNMTIGSPKFRAQPSDDWNVTSSTEFDITEIDDGQGSGVNFTWITIDGFYSDYSGVFTLTPGTHTITWGSEDNLGLNETGNVYGVFVEDTPPVTTLTVGNPNYGSPPPYVSTSTEFNLTASDGVGSGVAGIWYKIDSGLWTLYSGNFTISSPGAHTIYYNSTDNLNHKEVTMFYDILVDDSPPDTTLSVGEAKYGSSPTYVNPATEFNLTATDSGGSGLAGIWYKLDSGTWTPYGGNFTISSPGAHTFYYNSTDNLGQNEISKLYDIFLDDVPPDTTLTIGTPKYSSIPTYVNTSTEFNLTATDGLGSGVAGIWYKIDSGAWTPYGGDFTISSPGAHTIYYNSTDNLGYDEGTKSYDIFVDDLLPDTILEIGNPKYGLPPPFVSTSTEFNLTATDDLGSGVAGIWYKIDSGIWTLYSGNFTISSPGAHTIYYNSTDNLGQDEVTKFYDIIVDDIPPETTLTIGTPKYSSSPTYVNTSTEFNLMAKDGLGSGLAGIWYKIDSGAWTPYGGNFTISSPGTHTIYYNSTDNLGQDEGSKSYDIFVDDLPPETTLTVSNPKYSSSPTYVNMSTEFNLTATDGLGSGLAGIWYKIDSGTWTPYGGNFTISAPGVHTIYYNSTDNLARNELTNSYDIFVDNLLPDTTLEVGNPKYGSPPPYVNKSTEFNLTATDGLGSGLAGIWYKIDSGTWTLYSGNFTISTSGAHTIYYNSTDNLGQDEDSKSYDIVVDGTPPDTTLTVGTPKYSSSPTYVNMSTEFNLTATDGAGSGVAGIWYKIDTGIWTPYSGDFTISTPGAHTIYYNSTDHLGQDEWSKSYDTVVDDAPPSTNLFIGEPKHREDDNDFWNVSTETIFTLSPMDQFSGVDFTWYTIDGSYFEGLSFNLSGYSEGLHTITYGSADNLGFNETNPAVTVYLNTNWPETILTIEEPTYRNLVTDYWNATSLSNFILDPQDTPAGINFTWYTIDGQYFGGETFTLWGHGDGLHSLTWGSQDNIGFNETDNFIIVILDDSEPDTDIDISTDKYRKNPGDDWNITSSTTLILSPADQYSGVEITWYMIDGDYFEDLSFNLSGYGEGEHTITWGSRDNLGNNETGNFITVWVDDSDPVTSLVIGSPRHPTMPYDGTNVTFSTTFSLTRQDYPSHNPGIARTWYKIDSDYYEGTGFDLSGRGEGLHTITWGSEDRLANREPDNIILVYLDDSPPITEIDVGAPKYRSDTGDDWNVTETTIITLLPFDLYSGVYMTWYKIDGVYFEGTSFTLSGYKEGLHTITWGSTDNLNRYEPINTMLVNLDNSPPITQINIENGKYRDSNDDFLNVTDETTFTLEPSDMYSGANFSWYTIDGKFFEGISFDLDEYSDGIHTITWGSMDNLDHNETTNSMVINLDTKPPSVAIEIGEPKLEDDNLTIINSSTEIILISSDIGAGSLMTYYRFDGGHYSIYDEPFRVPATTTSITYYSEDNLGHETEKYILIIRVDNTDTDGDGEDDIADVDDDGDGLSDTEEDVNQNGIVDEGETDPLKDDTDGDGHDDMKDLYPLDNSRWEEPNEWEKLPIVGDMDPLVCFSLAIIVIIVAVLLIWSLVRFVRTRRTKKF